MLDKFDLQGFFSSSSAKFNRYITSLGVVFGITIVLTTLVEIFYYHHPLPSSDHWVTVNETARLFAGEFKVSDLFFQNCEHRIVVPRVFYFLDYLFFQGKGVFLIIFIFSTQLLHWIVLLTLYKHAVALRVFPIGVASLIAAMLFSIMQSENFYSPFQVCFVGVYAAASCAFLSYTLALERKKKGVSFFIPILGIFISMIISPLMMANGVFVGLALLIMSILQRQYLHVSLVLGLIFGVTLFLYTYGFVPVDSLTPYSYILNHPLNYTLYFFHYLGNIFSVFGHYVTKIIGSLGFFLFLYGCWLVWIRKVVKSSQISLLGVSLFVLISVAVTGLGRSSFGVNTGEASRYTTPGFIFWATQVLFWMNVTLEGFRENLRKTILIMITCLISISIAISQSTILFSNTGLHRYTSRELAALALACGVDDCEVLQATMPFSSLQKFIICQAQWLKDQHLCIFEDPTMHLIGRKLSASFVINPERDPCGFISHIVPLSTLDGVRVSGWAWDIAKKTSIKRILFVNQDNIIVGIGSGGIKISDFLTEEEIRSESVGWQGFAKRPAGSTIKAFGIINNGIEACPIQDTLGLEKKRKIYEVAMSKNIREEFNKKVNTTGVATLFMAQKGYQEAWNALGKIEQIEVVAQIRLEKALEAYEKAIPENIRKNLILTAHILQKQGNNSPGRAIVEHLLTQWGYQEVWNVLGEREKAKIGANIEREISSINKKNL